MKRALLATIIFMGAGAAMAAPAPVDDLAGNSDADRISRLERVIKAKQQADFAMQNQVDTLQQDVQNLRGLVEQQTYQLNQMLERQRQLYDEIAQLSTSKPAAPAASADVVNSQPAVAADSSLDETASYEYALNLVRKDRLYDEAIPAFQNFIEQYPHSTLIPNANYWLGQLLYKKKDYAAAQKSFAVVVNNYPKSSKRADCMLKLGLIAEKSGDQLNAKKFYKQVLKEYANSSAARIAGQQLTGLKA